MKLARTGIFTFATLVAVGACSDGKSGNGGNGDAGADPDAGGPSPITFSPDGCSYTVTIPATRGFTDFAKDDGTAPSGDITPKRVRLGLGGGTLHGAPGYADPTTTAAFTWETAVGAHAAKIKLGPSPTSLSEVHTGFSWTTPPPTIGFGDKTPAYFHEVHVCGLKPATTYYYQVGGGAPGNEVWSATQSFTTAPSSGPMKVAVLGDARDKVATWQLVQNRLLDAGVVAEVISGDIVDLGGVQSLYTQWLDAIWKDPKDPTRFQTLGQLLMLPIAGNHENEAAQFYASFAIPGDGAFAEQYASLDLGNTHLVMIDDQPLTQDGSDAGAAILAWLDKDLAAANANRAKVPFIAAVSHRGMYSTSLHSTDGDVLQVRGKLAPLFDKYQVDFVFNGHDHEYERSKPLKAGTPPSGKPVVGSGTTYVICAGAGAEPYSVGAGTVDYREKSVAFGNSTPYIGTYSVLEQDGTKLTLKAYGLKAAGTRVADDDLLDTVTLSR